MNRWRTGSVVMELAPRVIRHQYCTNTECRSPSRAISSLPVQKRFSAHWSSTSRSHSSKAAFDVGLIPDDDWTKHCRLATGADAWTRWLVRDLASPQWG